MSIRRTTNPFDEESNVKYLTFISTNILNSLDRDQPLDINPSCRHHTFALFEEQRLPLSLPLQS